MHPELTEDDEKTLMFSRINHELSEREILEQERQGLLKKKQGLIADNKKRKDDLASLDKDLETFIDVGHHQVQTSMRGCVMLTRVRLPNLYKRSSRSNIKHARAMVPFFEERRLSSVLLAADVPKAWHIWGNWNQDTPFAIVAQCIRS